MSHGRHIKVLGRGEPSLLGSVSTVESFLKDAVERLGMRMLGDAHMYNVELEISKMNQEPFEDEGGITGVCVLSTSHCSIHTWPLRPFFVLDVYSCRDFDARAIEELIMERFGAYHVQITDVSESLVYRFEGEPARKHTSVAQA